MRYILLFFWSAVLVSVLNYVVGAINNVPTTDWTQGLVMSLVFSVLLIIIGAVIPKESPKAIHRED